MQGKSVPHTKPQRALRKDNGTQISRIDTNDKSKRIHRRVRSPDKRRRGQEGKILRSTNYDLQMTNYQLKCSLHTV